MVYPIGLSPNIERDDIRMAFSVLCTPWKWLHGKETAKIALWFEKQFKTPYVYFFSSGRSALTALLEAMHIGAGDEVIVQAFTCMVVPNSIRFTDATPIFIDIDNTANCDPKDLEKKITSHTKAIIVQHTFGIPADMEAIFQIAKKHGVFVIEDCAHALGATYKGKQVGTLGDAAFFSFGRDKCVSSVFGGAVIVKNKVLAARLEQITKRLPLPSRYWIFQQLMHPIITGIALPLYASGIGKGILVFFQKLHILSFPVEPCEKKGQKPHTYIMKYPNALAMLLLHQLKKLDYYIKTRRYIASIYRSVFKNDASIQMQEEREGSSYLRFCIRVRDQNAVFRYAKQNGLILGNWYHAVIDPVGSNKEKAGYTNGSCRKAEVFAAQCINLPTRITKEDADIVVRIVEEALHHI